MNESNKKLIGGILSGVFIVTILYVTFQLGYFRGAATIAVAFFSQSKDLCERMPDAIYENRTCIIGFNKTAPYYDYRTEYTNGSLIARSYNKAGFIEYRFIELFTSKKYTEIKVE